jgi:DNA-3-methyladenine glycosylase
MTTPARDDLPPGALEALPAEALDRPLLEVARQLLGRLLVVECLQGLAAARLVEVEAYAGEHDPASHAYRGRTPRNAVMFEEPGRLYVYFSYGMHWCMNVVCGPRGIARAVLLRAGEPVLGAELMARRRAGGRPRDLTRGPARLTQALGLDGSSSGISLVDGGPVRLAVGWPVADADVRWTPRVGISRATDRPWRVLDASSPWVSPFRPSTRVRGPRADHGEEPGE